VAAVVVVGAAVVVAAVVAAQETVDLAKEPVPAAERFPV
jgi:hypothetical protein